MLKSTTQFFLLLWLGLCVGCNVALEIENPVVTPEASSPTDSSAPVQVVSYSSVASATWHSCALKTDGKILCWGNDSGVGMLGDDGASIQAYPVEVDVSNLAPGEIFTDLVTSAGAWHTCALTNLNQAYCWGGDWYGQLGDGGTNTNKSIPTPVDTGPLAGGEYFSFLTTANGSTCGITNLNKTFCWGIDGAGVLGNGGADSNESSPTPIDTTNLAPGEHFITIDGGADHFCGVTNFDNAFCWGRDSSGQLGTSGLNSNQSVPTAVTTTNLAGGEFFSSVIPGEFFTCGLSNLGNVFCWGDDSIGQLGDGAATSGSPIPVPINVSNLA